MYIQGIKSIGFLSKNRRRFIQFLSLRQGLKALHLIIQIDTPSGHGFDRGSILLDQAQRLLFLRSVIKKRRREGLHSFDLRDAGAHEQDCIKIMSVGGQAGQAADIALWETKKARLSQSVISLVCYARACVRKHRKSILFGFL